MNPSGLAGAVLGTLILAFATFVFGTIVWTMVKTMRGTPDDDASPVLILPARVVAKRTDPLGGPGERPTDTAYLVTFEFARGDRREYGVRADEYGLLAEGDAGELTAQGSRFRGFARGVE